MNPTKNKRAGHTGSSIGDRITAKEAARLAGLTLPQVVQLCREKKIFGIHEGGLWYVSPAVLDELREMALLLQQPRTPIEKRIFV